MKKHVVLLLAACLLLTAGCGQAPDTAEPAVDPPAAATAAPEATEAPAPTAEPTAEPTAAPRLTAGEETVYVLCEGKTDGGRALGAWLRSGGASVAAAFIPGGLDVPMYTLCASESAAADIPAATDETRLVRLAADEALLESGLLGALLPAFESAAGYVVEIYVGEAAVLAAETPDVVLVQKSDAAAFDAGGYPSRVDYISTVYSIS